MSSELELQWVGEQWWAVMQIRLPGIQAGYWEMDKVCQYLGDQQMFVCLWLWSV